jgi:hypothetical protein
MRVGVIGTSDEVSFAALTLIKPPAPSVTATAAPIAAHRDRIKEVMNSNLNDRAVAHGHGRDDSETLVLHLHDMNNIMFLGLRGSAVFIRTLRHQLINLAFFPAISIAQSLVHPER